jgi:hypothetical protein
MKKLSGGTPKANGELLPIIRLPIVILRLKIELRTRMTMNREDDWAKEKRPDTTPASMRTGALKLLTPTAV